MTTAQPTYEDRPRPDANQFGAGSPITQQRAQETNSMTDTQHNGAEWVPPIGKLEVAPERAELIRGLYQLAAWVADHPDLPLPKVRATVVPPNAWRYDEDPRFEDQCGLVDRVADALGVPAKFNAARTHYAADGGFGPVEMSSTAITDQHMAAHNAFMSSYKAQVRADRQQAAGDAEDAGQIAAGGAR